MKKIFYSVASAGVVAAIAIAATGAFFSDSETSVGNTFAAGAIDLLIDNTSYGFDWNDPLVDDPSGAWGLNTNNSWGETDLDEHLFFSFADLKPGDYGEDTISLHVNDNDAYACMAFDLTGTPENGQNEPEAAVDPTAGADEGELQNYLSFLFWHDDGDNVYEVGEVLIQELSGLPGSVFTGSWLPLAEGGDTPLPGDTTSWIGKGWCFGTMEETPVARDLTDNTPPSPGFTGFTCNGEGDHNVAQTDGIRVNVGFYAVQSRNNSDFSCANLPPFNGKEEERPIIGAALDTYVQPTGGACDVTVDDSGGAQFTSIQDAIDDADTVDGDTVCVAAGTYAEDVNVSKEVELAGAGAASTFVIGQTSGEAGAMVVTANNVTVRGFDIIDATGGIAALRISGAHSGILVNSNRLSSASGGANAFLTDGGQSNVMLSNNEFVGNTASQLVYVNGTASVAVASSNVDFFENSFSGTIIAGGVVLGNESTGSDITENTFASTLTSTYAILESWEDDANVNFNNFNGVGGIKVRDSDAGAGPLDAENNWWGAAAPVGHISGDVDDDPKAVVAFPVN